MKKFNEECYELIEAILVYEYDAKKEKKNFNRKHIIEELADNYNLIYQFIEYFETDFNFSTYISLDIEEELKILNDKTYDLIETIKNYIVKDAGVNVIITTHSPTTVALADEDNLFEMNREKKIPEKVTKEHALSILCEGIPSLRVSIDKQRVIFVESNYDADNYGKLFELVKKYIS